MRTQRGFSLIEVMVALVIVAVGLLGLAKMESLALSSTSVASGRSMAAIQASSMAAAMHANRAFWGSGDALASYTITSSTTASTACTSFCTKDQMAQYDMAQWAQALGQVLPNYLATINCTTSGPPITCTITVMWAEAGVAINPQQTGMATLGVPTYSIFVEP